MHYNLIKIKSESVSHMGSLPPAVASAFGLSGSDSLRGLAHGGGAEEDSARCSVLVLHHADCGVDFHPSTSGLVHQEGSDRIHETMASLERAAKKRGCGGLHGKVAFCDEFESASR